MYLLKLVGKFNHIQYFCFSSDLNPFQVFQNSHFSTRLRKSVLNEVGFIPSYPVHIFKEVCYVYIFYSNLLCKQLLIQNSWEKITLKNVSLLKCCVRDISATVVDISSYSSCSILYSSDLTLEVIFYFFVVDTCYLLFSTARN